ncbi:MAG: N utilization substance protein A [Parcubacteria group bacterium Gr01-1014_30]|nr:MAG: N utilization substance protein A [Parcubacteria group bacterium Gr01-1014_30]
MDIKSFTSAIAQIAEERGILAEKVVETIESAVAAAYKKEYTSRGKVIKCKLDPVSGEAKFWQVLLVVDDSMIYSELAEDKSSSPPIAKAREEELAKLREKESEEGEKKIRFNPEKHIMIAEAKKANPKVKPGEELEIPLKTEKDFGRIATQTAKQVILQKIKETERETILQEYKAKEGEIVSGIVQRVEGRNVYMDIGKTTGVLVKEEQIPGEFYRPGARLKVFVLKAESTQKGPVIFLSRAYPKLISKLFELEVPEVASGAVLIKSIAREPGSRTKIAVASNMEGVDPIGSVVGQRGTRVQAVIQELGGEKIDIVEWSDDPEKYITNSLSPAKVLEVKIMPKNKAQAVVPEDQLSLAIGKDGQNVRLAAKLTGWKIDVRPPEAEEARYEEQETNKKQ